jgi:hypothetical protein
MRPATMSGSAEGARRKLTYANVMSTLAVILLLVGGGTAVASNAAKNAAKNSVTSKSVKDNAIQSKDLRDGAAVGSADVVDGSLSGQDVQNNSLTGDDIDESKLTLPASSVGSGNVTDNSLTEADLGTGSVTSSELGPITRVESSVTVASGANGTGITTCPAGQIALSGGARSTGNIMTIFALSKENATEAWVAQANNASAGVATLTTFVYCLAA